MAEDGAARTMNLSTLFTQWHVVTQDRMFAHLSAVWRTDVPRVMIDAGCHAGHGPHKNVSDALLWLDRFHHQGSEVLALDAFEDFALDLQYRFDHHPVYASYTGVRKRAIAVALAPRAGTANMRGMARMHITCCADRWCNHRAFERRGSDHLCKLTRMRLGILPSDGRDRQTRYPPNTTSALLNDVRAARYDVPARRLDELWASLLRRRHIDLLKIDVDASWRTFGFEEILARRAVSVVVFEVDGAWRRPVANRRPGDLDMLLGLAHRHGYGGFVKVPCRARSRAAGSMETGGYARATRLLRLTNVSAPFVPTGFYAPTGRLIQDFVLMLEAPPRGGGDGEAAALARRMEDDCRPAAEEKARRRKVPSPRTRRPPRAVRHAT